jgi:hypothetical protein
LTGAGSRVIWARQPPAWWPGLRAPARRRAAVKLGKKVASSRGWPWSLRRAIQLPVRGDVVSAATSSTLPAVARGVSLTEGKWENWSWSRPPTARTTRSGAQAGAGGRR